MADLTITAANVISGTDAIKDSGVAGIAITAGQSLALDTTTTPNTIKLCDVNSASAWQRTSIGISLHAAAPGQPIAYQKGGKLAIGATVAIGTAYYASGTPGGIRPGGDNTTGDYPMQIGIGVSTTEIRVTLQAAGAAL